MPPSFPSSQPHGAIARPQRRAMPRWLAAACAGVFSALVLACAGVPTASAADTAAAMRAEQTGLERALQRQHDDLAAAQASYDEIARRRALARKRFDAYVVRLYMQGSFDQLELLLNARSMRDASEAARAAHALAAYERRLLVEIEAIDDKAQIARNGLSDVQQRMVEASNELAALGDRIEQQQRDREAALDARQRARAAAKLAASVPTMSAVGLPTLAGFGVQAGGGAASAAAIDAYLAVKGSPMAGAGQHFLAAGARWNLDPRLVVAVAGAESDFGAQTCANFNAWGWGCPTRPIDFDSWADGIDSVAEGLRRYYLDEGRTTVATIHQKYAPVGAANDPTGLNSHWVRNVSKFLVEQGGDPNQLSGGGVGGSLLPTVPGPGFS